MTLIGYLWAAACLLGLFRGVNYWFFLLLLSGVFQSSSVINLSDKGVAPFLFVQFLFILKYGYIIIKNHKMDSATATLFLFFIYCSVLTLISPYLFSGLEVYTPSLGIDMQAANNRGVPLQLTFGNIAQIVILFINVVVVFIVYSLKDKIGSSKPIYSMIRVCWFVVIFGFLEFFLKVTGNFEIIDDFIHNNNGYSQNSLSTVSDNFRLTGTFIEASFAGAFLASAFWFSFSMKKFPLTLCCGLALILNLSGTGILSFIFGGIIYAMINRKFKSIFYLSLVFLLFFIIAYVSGYLDLVVNMLETKADSSSGLNRYKAASHGLKLLSESYGMGVGLGSHRSGSFLADLFANTGVIGGMLFFAYWYTVVKKSNHAGVKISIIVLMVSQMLAIPDLSFSVFWCFIMLSVSQIWRDTDYGNFPKNKGFHK